MERAVAEANLVITADQRREVVRAAGVGRRRGNRGAALSEPICVIGLDADELERRPPRARDRAGNRTAAVERLIGGRVVAGGGQRDRVGVGEIRLVVEPLREESLTREAVLE